MLSRAPPGRPGEIETLPQSDTLGTRSTGPGPREHQPGLRGPGGSWRTANDAVLAEGTCLSINAPIGLAHVKLISLDERGWRHITGRDKYVNVIIDLTTAP